MVSWPRVPKYKRNGCISSRPWMRTRRICTMWCFMPLSRGSLPRCDWRLVTPSARRTTLRLASRRLALPSFGIGSLCVEHGIAGHIAGVRNWGLPGRSRAWTSQDHITLTSRLARTSRHFRLAVRWRGGCLVTPSTRRSTLRLASQKLALTRWVRLPVPAASCVRHLRRFRWLSRVSFLVETFAEWSSTLCLAKQRTARQRLVVMRFSHDGSFGQFVSWGALTVSLGTVEFLQESVTGHLKSRDRVFIALLPVFLSRPVWWQLRGITRMAIWSSPASSSFCAVFLLCFARFSGFAVLGHLVLHGVPWDEFVHSLCLLFTHVFRSSNGNRRRPTDVVRGERQRLGNALCWARNTVRPVSQWWSTTIKMRNTMDHLLWVRQVRRLTCSMTQTPPICGCPTQIVAMVLKSQFLPRTQIKHLRRQRQHIQDRVRLGSSVRFLLQGHCEYWRCVNHRLHFRRGD